MSAVTQNSYIGNGSTTNYSFTFPYLKSTDVQVQVDATVTTAWQFANATTVQFNTAPANGAKIKILRETNVDSLTATFYAGSAIKSEDLNDNYTQNLYKTQEIGARFFSNTGGTMTGDLTMAEDTSLIFEGATDDNFETVLAVADPTADRTITLPNVTGTVVTTGDTGTVATAMIANDAITNAKIANDQIDSEHYVDGSIDTQHIADSQITSAKIANGTIVDADINASAAIAGSKIAPTFTSNIVVTNDNPEIVLQDTGHNPDYKVENADGVFAIRDTTNSTDRITIAANGDVTITNTLTADLADNSINSEHYVNGSIDTEHIADSQITSAKIADGTIVAGDLASNAVTTAKITDANVTTAKIADSNVTTAKIAADAITGAKIADDQINSEHYVDGSIDTAHIADSQVTTAKIANANVTTAKLPDDAVTTAKIADAELKTLAGMQSGTASKLADSTALTADIADLNQIDGLTKQTTISDSDASFPTSGAVVDYVAAQIAPLGGLEVIATEVAFPNTQPQAGVVISISDAGGVVFNGSGTSTTGRTVGGSTVTINNAPSSLNSETLAAGVGLMVSSTGSGQIYNYHKILGKEDDIKQLSDDINDFNARYRVGSSNPTSALDAGDLFFNTSTSKLLVYNATNSAWEEAQSIGNFYISTLSPAFDGSTQDFTITNAPTNAEQIILSINGVIQKPNAGTSTPSEGFALSGSTVKLAAAPASGDDYFAVVIGSTVNIGTPSNNTVSTAILQNGSVTTAKIADSAVTSAKIADSAVTSAKIADGAIVNADVNASAAIAKSKLAALDIVNADVNASAAIAGTKIAPDFGSTDPTTTGKFITNSSSSGDYVRVYAGSGTGKWDIYGNGANLRIGDNDSAGAVTIDTNVGIGTTSPDGRLHCVTGAANDNAHVTFHASATTGTNNSGEVVKIISSRGTGNANPIFNVLTNTSTSVLTATGSGLVGIGTSSASRKLHVNAGTDNVVALFESTDAECQIRLKDNATSEGIIGVTAGAFAFENTTTGSLVKITDNGKVGIGTTSPSAFLEVISASSGRSWTPQSSTELVVERNGNCFLSIVGTNTANCMINFSDSDDENVGAIDYDHANNSMRFRVNDGTRMVISSNGDIGGAGGGDNIHDASDERLKENMIELTDGLNKINQLKPISYNYKAGWNETTEGRTKYGFGAQTTEKVDKVLVELFSDEDVFLNGEAINKPLRVNEKFIIPMLVKAVQELSAKNTALETKVAALEAA